MARPLAPGLLFSLAIHLPDLKQIEIQIKEGT
jgi:hypothetical protein